MRPYLTAVSVVLFFLCLNTVYRCDPLLPLLICTFVSVAGIPSFLCDESVLGNLSHRHDFSSVCMYAQTPAYGQTLFICCIARLQSRMRRPGTRTDLRFALSIPVPFRCRTSQFQSCFLPHVIDHWSFSEVACISRDVHSSKCKANRVFE